MAKTSAQAIQVRPVAPQQDNDMQQLTQTLLYRQNIERQKAEQELQEAKFLRESMRQQQEARNTIFGNSVKSLETYFNAAGSIPSSVSNQILEQGISQLSMNMNDADFMSKAAIVVAKANSQLKGWQNYFKSTEDTVKELTEQYGMDANAIRQFAEKNMYQYGEVQPGVIDVVGLKDASQMGDVAGMLKQEVLAHPDLYQDSRLITDKAIKEMQKISKDTEVPVSKSEVLDKTGRYRTGLASEFKSNTFDTELVKKDPNTGKPYITGRISTVEYKDPRYTRPDGSYYEALSEDKYGKMMEVASPILKQRLHTGAIEAIRYHNAQAFQAAGLNPSAAYTISDKNIDSFWGVKGFINPYDQNAIDSFQRMYAVDLIKNATGRYNEDGTVKESKITSSAAADNPRGGGSGGLGGGGGVPGFVDYFTDMKGQMRDKQGATGRKYAQANTAPSIVMDYVGGLLKKATGNEVDVTQYRYEEDPTNPNRILVVAASNITKPQKVQYDANGKVIMSMSPGKEETIMFGKNKPIITLDKKSMNQLLNSTFGNKAEMQAATYKNPFGQ